jgi:dihydrofolate synthase / folylpolyglutamate synthase
VRTYPSTILGLRGAHQITNAAVAVCLLEVLEKTLRISPEAIVSGLSDVTWPGRLQMLEIGGRHLLLDAAHNPAGASALADYLLTAFGVRMPIVFAAMRDKDAEQMIDLLSPAASVFVTTAPRIPRARDAAELAAVIRARAPSIAVEAEPVPRLALERAWRHAPVICAAGSIFLIGDLLESLMLSFEGLPISRG